MNKIKSISDTEVGIDSNSEDICMYSTTGYLDLEQAYKNAKKIQHDSNKTVFFQFNGFFMEINENTTYRDVKESYALQHKIRYANYAKDKMEKATSKLKEQNIKQTVNKLYKELSLSNPISSSFKPYITAYDQQQFFGKLYRIYRKNHRAERVESLISIIGVPEVPKVKIKKA